jgi:hypothetical protein
MKLDDLALLNGHARILCGAEKTVACPIHTSHDAKGQNDSKDALSHTNLCAAAVADFTKTTSQGTDFLRVFK